MIIYLQLSGDDKKYLTSYHTSSTQFHTVQHDIEESFLNEILENGLSKYYYENGEIILDNNTINKNKKIERLIELKGLLGSTDWKIIVNQELKSLGQAAKYNEEELHNQRQAWRDEINQLEFEISMLG